jgi:hypothetical protein
MNRRRLRLPAAMAILAVAAPVLAADPGETPKADLQAAAASLQNGAHEIGQSVRENSQQLHDQVARGVHQFRHEFTIEWYHTGNSIHRWWDNTRSGISRF